MSNNSISYIRPDQMNSTLGMALPSANTSTSTPTSNDSNQELFELTIQEIVSTNLWIYVGIPILIVGTVGHILSIIVLTCSKSMKAQSSTVYLIAMSVTGIVALYVGLLRQIVFMGFHELNKDVIRDWSDAFCRIHAALSYGSLQYLAWLQATISVDRLISVFLPHSYITSCKQLFAVVAILIELGAVVLLQLPVILISMGHNENGLCDVLSDFHHEYWVYIDLTSYCLLPAIILIPCNIFILVLLKTTKMKNGGVTQATRSITVMLMVLNLIFLLTTLPVSVIGLIDWGDINTTTQRFVTCELLWTIFSLLQYGGSASTFFIYCLSGSKFREELKKILQRFCCNRRCRAGGVDTRTPKSSIRETMNTRVVPYKYSSIQVSNNNMNEMDTSITNV